MTSGDIVRILGYLLEGGARAKITDFCGQLGGRKIIPKMYATFLQIDNICLPTSCVRYVHQKHSADYNNKPSKTSNDDRFCSQTLQNPNPEKSVPSGNTNSDTNKMPTLLYK